MGHITGRSITRRQFSLSRPACAPEALLGRSNIGQGQCRDTETEDMLHCHPGGMRGGFMLYEHVWGGRTCPAGLIIVGAPFSYHFQRKYITFLPPHHLSLSHCEGRGVENQGRTLPQDADLPPPVCVWGGAGGDSAVDRYLLLARSRFIYLVVSPFIKSPPNHATLHVTAEPPSLGTSVVKARLNRTVVRIVREPRPPSLPRRLRHHRNLSARLALGSLSSLLLLLLLLLLLVEVVVIVVFF